MEPREHRKKRKRGLGRRLFVPGLVVLALSLAAWVASMWVVGYRAFWSGGGELTVSLDRGELLATTQGTYWGRGWGVLAPLDSPFPLARMTWWPYDGTIWDVSQYGWRLQLPLWMPATLGVAAAVAGRGGWWRHRIERRRRKRGLCAGCGYDLAGVAGVCPECGM